MRVAVLTSLFLIPVLGQAAFIEVAASFLDDDSLAIVRVEEAGPPESSLAKFYSNLRVPEIEGSSRSKSFTSGNEGFSFTCFQSGAAHYPSTRCTFTLHATFNDEEFRTQIRSHRQWMSLRLTGYYARELTDILAAASPQDRMIWQDGKSEFFIERHGDEIVVAGGKSSSE